jgi:hypothetical protein
MFIFIIIIIIIFFVNSVLHKCKFHYVKFVAQNLKFPTVFKFVNFDFGFTLHLQVTVIFIFCLRAKSHSFSSGDTSVIVIETSLLQPFSYTTFHINVSDHQNSLFLSAHCYILFHGLQLSGASVHPFSQVTASSMLLSMILGN